MKLFFLRFFTWWSGATFGHAVPHAPARRTRRPRRVRQRLLPDARRRDRSGARLRAALGDLQRPVRGLDDAARLERLAASHGRHAAERRKAMCRANGSPHQGNLPARRRLSPERVDAAPRPPRGLRRRLRGVDAGRLSAPGLSPGFAWLRRDAHANRRGGAAGPKHQMHDNGGAALFLGRARRGLRRAGARRPDQASDRGLLRTRQDHRPNHLVRGGDRRDRAIRLAADHAARLLHAPADRGAADRRLRRGRRDRRRKEAATASSPAGCSPTAPACTASSIPSTTSG